MVTSVTSNSTATSSSTSQDAASLTGNYSMFLNLLTAQIKNQDPLSPMDTTEWTNQLVQYSSVEQQLKANQYLEKIANGSGTSDMDAAVAYIGKTVKADSSIAGLKDGAATWDYTLGGSATAATLTVKDANGTTVWSGTAPDLTKGTHSVTWNGQDSAGNAVPDGNYTLSVDAGTTTASVGVSGAVTSVENTSTGVVLNIGNTSIPLTSITSVS